MADIDPDAHDKERAIAFLEKWSSERFRADMKWLFSPPQGFDSWADYEKYGEAFIAFEQTPAKPASMSQEIVLLPKKP